MALTFLKKMKQVMPGAHDLRCLLHEHLHIRDPHRGVKTVHASELTKEGGICPRFYALADLSHAKLPDSWLSTSDSVTYHLGRVLQESVVGWFAEMGRAVGHWQCVACHRRYEFQARPIKCAKCGARAFRSEEVRFVSEHSGASCGIDLLVQLGQSKLIPVEIKTIDKDEFKKLVAPLAEHRLRTVLYLRLIAESISPWAKHVDTTKAEVLYVSKGGYGCYDPKLKEWGIKEAYSPFKSFKVGRDDAATDALVHPARVVRDWRSGLTGVPEGVCPHAMTKRAKLCSLRDVCFSGKYPPEFQWQGGQE